VSITCGRHMAKRDWRGVPARGMHRGRMAAVVALVAAMLAACGPVTAARPSPGPSVPPPTATAPLATPTPAPTAVPSPTPSPTPVPPPTATATLPPTATATHTRVPASQGNPAPVPILMYHHIMDLPDDAGAAQRDYAVSPARFEEQLQYLKAQGYESVSLYAIVGYLQGEGSLPAKSVAITFDDGYKDNAVVALPLLLKYGFTATFFINPKPIDDEYPGYMTWAQVEQIGRAGMDVESHSYSHPMLTRLSAEALLQEVRKAGDAIEKHTGKRPRLFSYPYGTYNRLVVELLRTEGYVGAVTLRSGMVQTSPSAFDLARVWVRYDDTLETFAAKVQRGR